MVGLVMSDPFLTRGSWLASLSALSLGHCPNCWLVEELQRMVREESEEVVDESGI
jgi:hypothetical protein